MSHMIVFCTQDISIQDEDTWAQHGVKDGSMMMMMGTAGEVPVAPVQQTVFIEDLDVNSQSAIVCCFVLFMSYSCVDYHDTRPRGLLGWRTLATRATSMPRLSAFSPFPP